MASDPQKPNWRGRIVMGVLVLMFALMALERYAGINPRAF